jgi:hypothetical protein
MGNIINITLNNLQKSHKIDFKLKKFIHNKMLKVIISW